MKKISFLLAAVLLLGLSACKSKQVQATASKSATEQADEIDRQIALKKKQMELDKLNAEAERQKKQEEMRLKEIENEQAQKELQKRKPVSGEQRSLVYCLDEGYDKPGEYMAGLGIVEDRSDRTHAILDANRAAIADIASRYIGLIKNAIEDYSKDVNVPSGKKFYESELEGGTKVIGQKVIEKYANVVCREIAVNRFNTYVGYVAVHVLLQDAKKGLADELEVRGVDYDKKKFFEKVDAEFAADEAKHKAELEKMEE